MTVQKYGRTTGWTQGEVAEINVTVDVCYEVRGLIFCVKQARFVDQIGISPGTFSSGGDSGSLIVTDDGNNYPVGLLFAGGSTRTFANPIDVVLHSFVVTVDDDSSLPPSPTNQPPTADFEFSIEKLEVKFTDKSWDSDPDGSVVAWSWDFDDGNKSTEQNPSNTYEVGGTYTVSLTVTDDDGAQDTASKDITVTAENGGITLTANGYKVKGRQKADLEWTGAASNSVDIYRNEIKINDTNPIANDGFYTDNIDKVGGGSYTYQVCEEGDTNTCSNAATVTF
jgi:PKD repeat protein